MWRIVLLNDAFVVLHNLPQYEDTWSFEDVPNNSVIQRQDGQRRFDAALNSYRID